MYEKTAQSLVIASERLRGNPHPGEFRKWRTARKHYRCADASSWGHAGIVEPGARYLEVVILESDVFRTPLRLRFCAECGETMK